MLAEPVPLTLVAERDQPFGTLLMIVPNMVSAPSNPNLASKIADHCVNGRFGHFVDNIAPSFQQVVIALSVASPESNSFFPSGNSIYTYRFKSPNVRVLGLKGSHSTDSPLRKLLVLMSRLRSILTAIRSADFVYISLPGLSSLIAHRLCLFHRKPFCLYVAADISEIAPFTTNWKFFPRRILRKYVHISEHLERRAVERSVFTLVHGKALIERLAEAGTQVVPTVPLTSISPAPPDVKEYPLEAPFRCLFVGTVTARKGVEDAVAAIKELRERGDDVELDIVGGLDEPFGTALREQVRSDGFERVIRFHGYTSDDDVLIDWYRKSHVFVLPTQGEGFPRVLYEAMSQRLPVIASDIGTIRSAIQNIDAAILVPPRSPSLLADAIQEVLTDSDLRTALVRAGYEFSVRALGDAADQFLSLLRERSSLRRGGVTGRNWPEAEQLHDWALRYYRNSDAYNSRSSSKWSDDWLIAFGPYIRDFEHWSPQGARVLDVGCGGGQSSYLLGSVEFEVVGVDLSSRAIQQGKAKMADMDFTFACADATRLPFKATSFGAVGFHATLEHLVNAREALEEGFRVLKPGGVIIVHGPNMISPVRWGGLFFRGIRDRTTHPDASLLFLAQISVLNLKKLLGSSKEFLYRRPFVANFEFPGSDFDAICLASTFDLRNFAREHGMRIISIGGGTSRIGKIIARYAPMFAGGIRFVAIKQSS